MQKTNKNNFIDNLIETFIMGIKLPIIDSNFLAPVLFFTLSEMPTYENKRQETVFAPGKTELNFISGQPVF